MRRQIGALPWCAAAIALLCSTAPSVRADEATSPPRLIDRLINLDAPGQAQKGAVSFQMGARVFRSTENRTYWQAALGYGLNEKTTIELRGGLTGKSTFATEDFTIDHGGSDVEVLARIYAPHSAFEVGCAVPHTPSQKRPCLTAQGQWEFACKSATFVLSPKAVLKERPLLGVGGGIVVPITPSFSLIGDATALVSGRNTISPLRGEMANTGIWGAGIRYGARDLGVEVGATNGLGCTTGLSLTPGLGGSTAYYASVTYRR